MFPPIQDLYRIAPEIVLCGFGMLVMLLSPLVPKARQSVLAGVALVGAALAIVSTIFPALHQGDAYSGLFRADAFSLFVHWIVCGVAFLVILGSIDYLRREDLDAGEFRALILFATAGMGVMAGAHELLTAFIGLEMSSIAAYVLASYRRDEPRSNEAAMKYFLPGLVRHGVFSRMALRYPSAPRARLTGPDGAARERLRAIAPENWPRANLRRPRV